jgi:hypothetical protein
MNAQEKRQPINSPSSQEFSTAQQRYALVYICISSLISFLPYMMGLELHDDEPEVPYNGAVDDELMTVTNAVCVACSAMMLIESFLDSFTMYIPIKIAFPRFIMVVGLFLVSLLPYLVQPEPGMDALSFMACSLFAKGYCFIGGLALRMLRDTAEENSSSKLKLCAYAACVALFTADFQLHQWEAYHSPSASYGILMVTVSIFSVLVGLYLVFRVVQLLLARDHSGFNVHHYYSVMSHMIVSFFFFATYAVVLFSPATTWKEYTVRELATYQFIGLFVVVFFFFASSYIAQRNFVATKVRDYLFSNIDI